MQIFERDQFSNAQLFCFKIGGLRLEKNIYLEVVRF